MKVYDVFCDESYVYLVEEFMESGTLDKYMKKKANWKEAEAGERISEVCSGMKYIHQKNLIHGGLKPSSILVSHVIHSGFRTHVSSLASNTSIRLL